jgi:hypothetical protein
MFTNQLPVNTRSSVNVQSVQRVTYEASTGAHDELVASITSVLFAQLSVSVIHVHAVKTRSWLSVQLRDVVIYVAFVGAHPPPPTGIGVITGFHCDC